MKKELKKKIHFIFAWRLSHEKWADRLVSLCDFLQSKETDPWSVHLHIFGEGSAQEELSAYEFVTCYGFQPQDVLFEKRATMDFCLMPSRFLETFWLSALESLSFGVPVIAEKKWGLAQFGEWVIEMTREWIFEETVFSLIQASLDWTSTVLPDLSKNCKDIAASFSEEEWNDRADELLTSSVSCARKGFHGKKVLLVSDYIWKIWWIETYIHDVYVRCRDIMWCTTVSLFWRDISLWSSLRYLSLPMSICNIFAYSRLRSIVGKKTYDLVWWHSVQRRLGRLPLLAVSKKTTQWMMYHDFGLLHPFPSQVLSEDQLIESATFLWYMRQWLLQKSFLIKGILFLPLCFKYLSTQIILSLLADRIALHLVPSAYMVPHIQRVYKQSVRVEVLKHCR